MNPGKQPQYEDYNDRPWIGLVYLFFVYLPLLYPPSRPVSAIVASVLATALFVPLYFWFFRTGNARIHVALMVVTALIGYALVPFNPGGNAFIIYAMVMAASTLELRHTVLLSVVMVSLLAAQFWVVISSPMLASGAVSVVAVIGAMAVAGIYLSRERARRQAELMLTQDEVRRLARMAERERIGRDLHDLLGHTLSVVALKSELAGKLIERDPVAARDQIREVEDVARQALAQVREAVAGIRATGLQAELAAARLALLSADITLDQRLAPVALPPQVEGALTMALREAVTNIIRHAGARRVEVELIETDREWQLLIADDGSGGVTRQGNGLTGMHERLHAVAGRIDIESPAGVGTRLLLRVPRTVTAEALPQSAIGSAR